MRISENLHRAELTVQERAEHIAEWVRLTGEKATDGQVVRRSERGRFSEGGVAQAARELPVSGDTDEAKRKNVERALKIAGLSDEAKEAAREAARLKSLSNRDRKLLRSRQAASAGSLCNAGT